MLVCHAYPYPPSPFCCQQTDGVLITNRWVGNRCGDRRWTRPRHLLVWEHRPPSPPAYLWHLHGMQIGPSSFKSSVLYYTSQIIKFFVSSSYQERDWRYLLALSSEGKRRGDICSASWPILSPPPRFLSSLARVWICMCMLDSLLNRECQSFGCQLHTGDHPERWQGRVKGDAQPRVHLLPCELLCRRLRLLWALSNGIVK